MLRKPSSLSLVLLTIILIGMSGTASAEESEAQLAFIEPSRPEVAPERMIEKSGIGPAAVLTAADDGLVHPITAWNVAGNVPLRNGVERALPEPISVSLSKAARGAKSATLAGGVIARSASDDATIWGVSIRTEKAWRTRVRLDDVRLPAGTLMWVYGLDGETVGPFGTELVGPDGTLWTPSVGGPEIRLEISVLDTAWDVDFPPTLRIEATAELFPLDRAGVPQLGGVAVTNDMSCLQDAACYDENDWPPIDIVKKAVALLNYQEGGSWYVCTGSLVNDKDTSSWIPYMLTANHCFSSQAAASTLEAFFDYIPASCGASAPSIGSVPRSTGATLLTTSSMNDSTFVRLSSLPSGSRGFLGWTNANPADGAYMGRISHPDGLPSKFSISRINTSPVGTCGLSQSNFHFSDPQLGGTFGGSSGSALLNDSGQIMGQLGGGCGPNPADGCDYSNYEYDGKFSVTYPYVAQYINYDPSGPPPCVQDLDDGVVCLRNGRFELDGTWTDFSNPPVTRPLIWTPFENINATAGFQNNPSGIQIVMRAADGCSQTGTYWIWLGGFTGAGWSITVRDTETGIQKTFSKPRNGSLLPTTTRDQQTFSCN
jgi:hypothetical protein